MNDPVFARRLELLLTILRGVGLVALAAAAWIVEGAENTLLLARFALIPLLLIGSIALGLINRSLIKKSDRRTLSAVSLVFDAMTILFAVWLFPVTSLVVLIPLEAAIRYRLRGALLAAAGVTLFILLVPPLDLSQVAVIGLLSFGIAFLIGSVAEMWHRSRLALEANSAKLVELDRLKDRHVAVTSHELRGPLTAIIAGIDTIKRRSVKLDPEKQDWLLTMVGDQGRQLARLVDDLMISSELEAGQLWIDPHMTELEATVNAALDGARNKRRAHQLEIFVDPLNAEIDGNRVSQMLRNLVENAYKYTPDRSNVTVSGRGIDGGIELKVADDGPGIPLEKRDVLFEAFRRIEETSAGRQGVGLGLFVVSQLAGAMGAQLDLASSSKGTTFTIRIPCRTEPIPHRRMGIISSEEPETREG